MHTRHSPRGRMNRRSHKDKAYDTKVDAIHKIEHYIPCLIAILGCARIWPIESLQRNRYKILLSFIITVILILLNALLVLSEIIMLIISSNLTLFIKCLDAISLHVGNAIKWYYCMYNNRRIFDIVMRLGKCHRLCYSIDDSEKGCQLYNDTMEQARRYCNYLVCIWISLVFYGGAHWCLNPLIVKSWGDKMDSMNNTFEQKELPYYTWHFWSIDTTRGYVSLYITQTIGGLFGSVFGLACYDAFYISLVIIICIQLQHINMILTETNFNNVSQAMADVEKKLVNCMYYHIEIIKFLEALQNFTSPIMFVQCLQTILMICIVSFEVATIKISVDIADKRNIFRLWSLIEYFSCAAIQLYFFCYLASQLQHLGLQLAQSVYSCGWELILFERKNQLNFVKKHYDINRLVQMIIEQAQKPIILSGGPFYVLSLETFRAVMSMAVSNSIMLRTISENHE